MKVYRARAKRSIVWDWKGEYDGELIPSLAAVPALFRRPTFRAVYRAPRWATVKEFDALCHVLLNLGSDFMFCVDEAATVCSGYAEGGLGQLLRYSRDQRIDLLWSSQRPCKIPGVFISEVNTLHVFHLHGRSDLVALSEVLPAEELQRVAALPPHQYITVNL
jgi:hypothetical protein